MINWINTKEELPRAGDLVIIYSEDKTVIETEIEKTKYWAGVWNAEYTKEWEKYKEKSLYCFWAPINKPALDMPVRFIESIENRSDILDL